jgi:hypothetical protein
MALHRRSLRTVCYGSFCYIGSLMPIGPQQIGLFEVALLVYFGMLKVNHHLDFCIPDFSECAKPLCRAADVFRIVYFLKDAVAVAIATDVAKPATGDGSCSGGFVSSTVSVM